MGDQAEKLRKIAWEKRKKAKYITISSGKGGVGKTNFSVNLSHLLASKGKKVLLFDADLGLANVDILLNITPAKNIQDYFEKTLSPADIIVKTDYSFDIIPAASGLLKLTSMDDKIFGKLIDIFVFIDDKYEYVIFDAGAGISENVMRFVKIADYNIVITQAEPTAVTDAYALIKVANINFNINRINLIINRIHDEKSATTLFQNIEKIIKKFLQLDINYLGSIKEDRNLLKAVKQQKPLAAINENSNYVKDLKKILKKIDDFKEIEFKNGLSIKDILGRFVL
jgi:flagellar biosynthesis protein FlhG